MKKKAERSAGSFAAALWQKYLPFILGIVIEALAVAIFLSPSGLTPGGFSGLAIALNNFFPIGTGALMLLLNIPIAIIGIWKFGLRFFATTLVAIGGSPALVTVFETYLAPHIAPPAPFPAAVAGGALIGLAVGLVFRAGASFGGTDIVVKLLRLKFRYMKTGAFYLLADGLIILFGTVALWNGSLDNMIYAVISVFVQSYVADLVLYGSEGARMLFIITNSEQEISKRITEELRSGVTYLKGTGAYTGKQRQLMLCVMRKQQVPKAKEIIQAQDPDAFLIVTAASQVLGRGYKSFDDEEV